MSMHKNVITLCCAAAFALGLAACSSSDDPPPPAPPPVDPGPSAYEAGKAAIMAAMTAADAQMAYDEIDLSMVSGDEAASLMMALDDRVAAIMAASAYADGKAAIMAAMTAADAQMAYDDIDKNAITGAQAAELMGLLTAQLEMIATYGRVDMQKMALMNAANDVDTSNLMTQADIDAAQMYIDALKTAIANAADVDDTSMYQQMVDDAEMDVMTAQNAVDLENRMAAQMMDLSNASTALMTALGGLSGTPTQAQIDDATAALATLNMAIADAADLDDTSAYELEAANAQGQIDSAVKTLAANTAQDEADRKQAEEEAEAERLKEEAEAAAMMAATAAKLYPGISMPTGTDTDTDGNRFAQHAAADGTNAGDIEVAINDATNVFLSEDEDMMVADNHGWEGKRYTRTSPATEGMYEAVVYSNVEDPTMGKKFGTNAPGAIATGPFQYQLNADNELVADEADGVGATDNAFVAARVALTGVTRTAGTETFDLPDPNDLSQTRIRIPGSYHGVSGNYYCTPGTPANGCSAAVASRGFAFAAGDTWVFVPTNGDVRVMESADTSYASYGWWIHKAANDGDFTASAFVDELGAESVVASGLTALNGTATYIGGAAGKYALRSSTGGTNDAGHFTARATLEADFTNNLTETAITGMIDMFMGADDQPRDWTVELNGSQISDDGLIGLASASTDVDTVWTIGGTDADASGNWTGTLRENGDDLVPQVATGTFYTEYGAAGRMVGGFGANVQ